MRAFAFSSLVFVTGCGKNKASIVGQTEMSNRLGLNNQVEDQTAYIPEDGGSLTTSKKAITAFDTAAAETITKLSLQGNRNDKHNCHGALFQVASHPGVKIRAMQCPSPNFLQTKLTGVKDVHDLKVNMKVKLKLDDSKNSLLSICLYTCDEAALALEKAP